MEAKDFYFEVCRDVSNTFYLITPKSYYDREGCLSDESGVANDILPAGFFELAESTYEFEGTPEEGRQKLLDIGMKEISFGFQAGEPSREADDEEYEDGDPDEEYENGDHEEKYDELDILLKEDGNNEPHPFDYKNVSTDKLIRHRKMMIETEAYEEAAKIRDELISRGVTE